jgi:lipooligosaccharide transport system permease protein
VSSGALRSYGYWATTYKQTWRGSVTAGFVNPLLYLAALGVGLGSLVDKHQGTSSPTLSHVSYLAFLAPGLLASTAMQTGTGESTWPVMASFRWTRQYHAMLATPLRVSDIVIGHVAWIATRIFGTAALFTAVLSVFGVIRSPGILLAIPAAVLVGLAFAAPIMAFAATRETDNSFAVLNRFVVLPLFLFSGTFFPISQLPTWTHPVAYVTPLWHGVQLCRGLDLGHVSVPALMGHTAVLLAYTATGVVAALRTYRGRLET